MLFAIYSIAAYAPIIGARTLFSLIYAALVSNTLLAAANPRKARYWRCAASSASDSRPGSICRGCVVFSSTFSSMVCGAVWGASLGSNHRGQHWQKSLALQVGQARMNRAVIPAQAGIQYPACEWRTSSRIASRFQT